MRLGICTLGSVCALMTCFASINLFCARIYATPGLLNGLARTGKKDAMIAGLIEQTPLERMADPDDIADIALFLASDDSRSMTGSEIFADGGMAQV